jgi:hypothetical protein
MLNDKLFGEKYISDILEEFYNTNKKDAKLTMSIVDALELTTASSFTGMFGEEDRAKLLNVLLTSKQKCTHNYKEILEIAAKLQKNALDSDDGDLNGLRKYMDDFDDKENDIVENHEDALDKEEQKIKDMIKDLNS